jgi:hypothetical protein
MKHFCWSCGDWKTCEDVKAGGSKFCEKWKRMSYKDCLDRHGKKPKGFMERVVKISGWLIDD